MSGSMAGLFKIVVEQHLLGDGFSHGLDLRYNNCFYTGFCVENLLSLIDTVETRHGSTIQDPGGTIPGYIGLIVYSM